MKSNNEKCGSPYYCVFLILFILLIYACGNDSNNTPSQNSPDPAELPSDETSVKDGTIEGYIYYSGTTIPISGVIVIAERDYDRKIEVEGEKTDVIETERFTATTDFSGFYSLNNLPNDTYELYTDKEGYSTYIETFKLDWNGISNDIYLTPNTSLIIEGTVDDADGNLLSGVNVILLNPDSTFSEINDFTDENGNFQIDMPSGSHTLRFELNGYQIKHQDINALESRFVTITLSSPPEVTISSPRDGYETSNTQIIDFRCVAIDDNGNQLSGESLIWASDIDGQVGIGYNFSTKLSIGEHSITLTGKDSKTGLEETTSITVIVNCAPQVSDLTGEIVLNIDRGCNGIYDKSRSLILYEDMTTSNDGSWSLNGRKITIKRSYRRYSPGYVYYYTSTGTVSCNTTEIKDGVGVFYEDIKRCYINTCRSNIYDSFSSSNECWF